MWVSDETVGKKKPCLLMFVGFVNCDYKCDLKYYKKHRTQSSESEN